MSSIQSTVEIQVPVRTAYNQWTQFEDFPRFMEGVQEVEQIDDTHLHWKAKVAGRQREWDAEITEQVPDQRIAWTTRQGPYNAGVVTFHRIDDDKTRVTLQMTYEPEGATEKAGDGLGFLKRRVEGDLERFREFLESRGSETGAWRGEIGAPPHKGAAPGRRTTGPGTH